MSLSAYTSLKGHKVSHRRSGKTGMLIGHLSSVALSKAFPPDRLRQEHVVIRNVGTHRLAKCSLLGCVRRETDVARHMMS